MNMMGCRVLSVQMSGLRAALVLAALLVSACVQAPRQAESESSVDVKEPAIRLPTREEHIQTLLYRADTALSKGRLLSPDYDNAYDRYAAVRLMEPNNTEARSGLQAIVLRYLDMARDAAQRSRFSEADSYLNRAAQILPDDPAVMQLVAEERAAVKTRPEEIATGDRYLLDVAALRAESETAIDFLSAIAQQARTRDQMVLIVAPSDAQGRWIYQQMREAVRGYRLRGDIRVGSPARVEFIVD
ncbi:MAG TPA: N-acetylglucosaminyltransferase [Cellvibrionaceae bacterium]